MASLTARPPASAAPAGAGVTGRRPRSVTALAAVLFFLGLTAVAGGTALVIGRGAPPDGWLDRIPLVDSWTIPGLVLGLGFGVGSLFTGYGVLSGRSWWWLAGLERRTQHHWSWSAAILLGLGQAVWLGLEAVYLPALSPLQFVYAVVAVALLVSASLRSTRTYLRRRTGPAPDTDTDTDTDTAIRP
jgi:hypothetical protein